MSQRSHVEVGGWAARQGFGDFVSSPFLWGHVRLLGAEKLEKV